MWCIYGAGHQMFIATGSIATDKSRVDFSRIQNEAKEGRFQGLLS